MAQVLCIRSEKLLPGMLLNDVLLHDELLPGKLLYEELLQTEIYNLKLGLLFFYHRQKR